MNDRLEEIRQRFGELKVQYAKLGGYGFKLISYEPIQLTDDLDWLISALESARAEIARWKFDADTTREAHICTFKRAETVKVDRDRLQALAERYYKGLRAVEGLIADSHGVVGLHLNGNVAPWDELRTGGRFEEWLLDFDAALEEKP